MLRSETICLFVFDVLSVNKTIVVNKPLSERKALLAQAFPLDSVQGLMHVPWSDHSTDLQENMKTSIEIGCEGLVLKKMDSVYSPGGRSSKYKIKDSL